MKTKNKTLALVEIAIVLCSVLLVATLSAVAAEQTTPKVSASTITTTSEDDFILEIYGNANEDDCIDMRDYTYAARIICWLEDETTFADANYDGRISVADMTQIGLIILGRESELTFVDDLENIVTVKKPIERIVVFQARNVERMRAIHGDDKIVGVCEETLKRERFFPEFSDYPSVGSIMFPDYEAILELQPDMVILQTISIADDVQDTIEELDPNIAVFRISTDITLEDIAILRTRKVGYILDKEGAAEEFIDFYEEYMNAIKDKVEGISEDERPKVFYETYYPYFTGGEGTLPNEVIVAAGGNNIFSDFGFPWIGPWPGWGEVSAEEVVERNPEVIVRCEYYDGYATDDTTAVSVLREEIMSRPELVAVPAVEDERVYIFSNVILGEGPGGSATFLGVGYMAKLLHPELFTDLDPQAMHQEYLDRFQRIDFDVYEQGVFVYPEEPI